MCDLGLAVNDRRKIDGEWTEVATFVDITMWGRQAEVAAEYLSKGSPVHIEGRLQLDSWENQEGEKRSRHEVIVENFTFLGSGRGEGGESRSAVGQASAGSGGDGPPPATDDDIPF